MRVLHLNAHASGGSYEYAAVLSTALAEQGIESRVLCKNSPAAETGRVLLDRVIRRAYVSFSTEPWHGTRRLLSPPGLRSWKELMWCTCTRWPIGSTFPSWLETLPSRMGVVISLHDMWHVTGGCFLYRGCDRYSGSTPCDSLSDFEMAFQSGSCQRRTQAQITCVSELWRPVCRE